jgi:uncharacterized protein YgiM (DUF1202 family)
VSSGGGATLVALLLIVLLGEVSWFALSALSQSEASTRVAETIVETRLRPEPRLRSEPLLRLPAGTTVVLYGAPQAGWYQAQHGQLQGFLRSGDVATAFPDPVISEALPDEAIDEPLVIEQAQRAGDRGRKSADNRRRASKGDRKKQKKQQRKRERQRVRAATAADASRVITRTDLNLRLAPSPDADLLLTMPRGVQVVLTGQQQDGWVEVQWEDASGWALGRHLAASRKQGARRDRDAETWSRQELKEIIFAAADRYGQPREDMLRVARCESNLVPSAVNRHGGSYGLFQFKPGTWLGTPFAEYDIFDPRASANAAAWMWSVGRRREWVCQ